LATLLEPVVEIWQLNFYFSTSAELGPFVSTTDVCICGNHIFQVQKMKKFVPNFFLPGSCLCLCISVFFCVQKCQNEKKGIFCHNIFIFYEKNPQLLKTKSFDFFGPHLDSDFSLVAYFKTSLLNYLGSSKNLLPFNAKSLL
jgi:hypothetical protein